MKRSTSLYLTGSLVAGLALSAGCANSKKGLGEAATLDRRRYGALVVFLDSQVTDSLDVPKGDRVDWKYVDVAKPGEIRVAVAFDNPERVGGEVVLRDTFGTVVERQRVSAARGLYAFSPVNAVRGRYYIEIAADKGASVYTVGVLFDEPDLGGFFTEKSRFSRPKNQGGGQGSARRPGNGGGGGGGGAAGRPSDRPGDKPSATTDDPSAKPGGEGGLEVPEEGAGTLIVRGSIRRLTPVEGGGTNMVIVLGGDASPEIKSGVSGVVTGLGVRVTVRSRNGNIARGFTKAEFEELQPYKSVVFRLKR